MLVVIDCGTKRENTDEVGPKTSRTRIVAKSEAYLDMFDTMNKEYC